VTVDLANKVVVVTGGSAGLGRAAAQAFAGHGAKVAVFARSRKQLDSTVAELKELGAPAALGLEVDVAEPEQVEKAADQVEKTLGPVDIWINNAMATVFGPFKELEPDEFRRVTEVTYLGSVYGTMAAMKRMLPRDQGMIVQVGSALSSRSVPLQAPYCGAKHALRGFIDSIRCELLHDKSKVRITMVQMPSLNTPQFNWCKSRMSKRASGVPPIFQPEIGADAIVFAATHKRREIYVGLPTVEAMWANKFFPGLLDRFLARTNYQAQQTDEPEDPDRPNNLWEPVNLDYGAHGRFDDKAHGWSFQWWVNKHFGWNTAMAGMIILAMTAAALLIRFLVF
jgi:NAD(P)-dependent dehydrogenase (short-subunit alcohol dehydrogenase family)